jgi:hypothetical protein
MEENRAFSILSNGTFDCKNRAGQHTEAEVVPTVITPTYKGSYRTKKPPLIVAA